MAQIYRVGKDIFDASTNQRIANPTVLATQYKGATEIKAPVIPTGATKIASPDQLKGLNESQLFRSGQDIYKLPNVTQSLSSDQLTSNMPNITPVNMPQDNLVSGLVASTEPTSRGLESAISTIMTPSATESQISPITKRVGELTGQTAQKPVDYQAELDKYGFQTNVQDLQNLNKQIASTKLQYDKLAEENINRPISSRIIGGTQDKLARQSAIELGGLSSMAEALQGNINMATDIADKTIAIKYEPIEKEIENQKFQLEQVYEQLSREDKKKADALSVALDERTRKIEEEKAVEKSINEIMVEAAKNGATSDILQNILKSKTLEEAVANSGGFYSAQPASEDLQFVAGTANQPAGYFNKTTGIFTPLGSFQGADPESLKKANNIVGLVDEISGLNLAGVTGLIGGRVTLTPNQILADSKIKQLTGLLTLDNMGIMKGVLSDADIKIIKEASTSLKRTLSEKDFRAELQKIKDISDRVIAGNEILGADPSRSEELKMIMSNNPDITGEELRQVYGLGFNSVGGDTEHSLGALSEKYESGGDSKAIGYDTTGGYSYGSYQLTKGNIGKFLNVLSAIPATSQLANTLKGVKIGTDTFNNLWKKAVDTNPQAFKQAEEKYIASTHYEPQIKKLEQSGVPVNKYSNILKQVIWSTAVQHGASTSIIANAYKSLKSLLKREPNEKELVAKIYNDRWSDGQNFKSSTPAVKKSVFNRFQDELKTALSKLSNKA